MTYKQKPSKAEKSMQLLLPFVAVECDFSALPLSTSQTGASGHSSGVASLSLAVETVSCVRAPESNDSGPRRAAHGELASRGGAARRAARAPAKLAADPVGNTGITSYRPATKVVAGALTS